MRPLAVVLLALFTAACSGSPAAPSRALADLSSPSLQTTAHPFSGGHSVLTPGNKYCFLITIDNSDNRGQVVQTINGSGSILDLVEGRDPEPSDPTIFNRYVLKSSLLPAGTADIPTVAWVGINTGVPAVVRNVYSQNTTLWRTIEFGGGTFSRAYMQNYLLNYTPTQGCQYGWVIVPGDALTVAAAGQPGDLLSKFVQLF